MSNLMEPSDPNAFQLPNATDALAWMNKQRSKEKTILFRGQTKIWKTIYPSLYRSNISKQQRMLWHNATRRFVNARNGITGYSVPSPHDALAIIQHYLGKSGVIDLTGDPEVALYFAIKGRTSNPQVVYAIDAAEVVSKGFVLCDHNFLNLPLDGGGLKHRWLRQDGFSVAVNNWEAMQTPGELDLLALEHAEFKFETLKEEDSLISHLGDLESTGDDPLASSVRSLFQLISQNLGLEAEAIISSMIEGSRTSDAAREIIEKIDKLIKDASFIEALSGDLGKICQLREAAEKDYWDTSWDAALDYWRREVDEHL